MEHNFLHSIHSSGVPMASKWGFHKPSTPYYQPPSRPKKNTYRTVRKEREKMNSFSPQRNVPPETEPLPQNYYLIDRVINNSCGQLIFNHAPYLKFMRCVKKYTPWYLFFTNLHWCVICHTFLIPTTLYKLICSKLHPLVLQGWGITCNIYANIFFIYCHCLNWGP